MINLRKCEGLFCILLLSPAFLSAQSQSDTLYRVLDQIEVTATKNTRTLSEVPGRVSVITAEQMALTPSLTVTDHLRTTSGVNARGTFGLISMRPNVTLRGLSNEEQARTLVMVDGVPVNNSDTGGVNWNSISTTNVKQIEVYKGPGSSLYGSNAMGGVINIITKKPVEPIALSAGTNYGTFNTSRSFMELSARPADNLSLRLHGFYNTSDGYITRPDSLRNDTHVARYVDDKGFHGKASYAFSDLLKISAGYDLFLNKRGEGVTIDPDGPGMYRKFDKNKVQVDLRGERNDFRYFLNMFFQREDYYRISERGVPGNTYSRFDVDSDRDDKGVTLDLFKQAGPNHSLTGGFEMRVGSVDGGDFYKTSPDYALNRGSMRFLAAYLQDEIRFLNGQMHLLLGLRFDHAYYYDGFFEASENIMFRGERLENYNNDNIPSNSWSTFSPRISMRYNVSSALSGYASYARGFRASILDDLTRTGIMWGRIKVVNPELGPETVDNFEAGLDYRPFWRLSLSPTIFYSHGNDFLYYVERELADGSNVWRRENVSSVEMAGAEMDIRYFATNTLTLSGSYSLYHSRILSFPDRTDLEGKSLTYTPRHQLKGALQWRNPIADLGVNALFKGSQFTSDNNNEGGGSTPEIDSYVTFDIMASRRFFDALTASVQVMDLFDNRHLETPEDLSPGRVFSVGLRYDFSR